MESLVSGMIVGVLYGLFSGQPLTIMGSTGQQSAWRRTTKRTSVKVVFVCWTISSGYFSNLHVPIPSQRLSRIVYLRKKKCAKCRDGSANQRDQRGVAHADC
jgi:hypothetical protein